LMIGCPDPKSPDQLAQHVDQVAVVEPGPLFAAGVHGRIIIEDHDRLGDTDYDLCVALGTLDTVNNLPLALANIQAALRDDSLLIGAISGGDTLPMLRSAMRAADAVSGTASPHIHPRIDGPSLCGLLGGVGFLNAVVDIDRVSVGYPALHSEVADLRAMGATNILAERSKIPLTRGAVTAAAKEFDRLQRDGRTVETFEILHFAAWTPSASRRLGRDHG